MSVGFPWGLFGYVLLALSGLGSSNDDACAQEEDALAEPSLYRLLPYSRKHLSINKQLSKA